MWSRVVLLVALAAGCGRSPAAELDARVDRCAAALEAAGPDQLAAAHARACRPIYRAAACRDAFAAAEQMDPSVRAAHLVETCRAAYCPRLAAPRPGLCEQLPAAPSQRLAGWRELQLAILRHELGAARAERLAGRIGALAPKSIAIEPP